MGRARVAGQGKMAVWVAVEAPLIFSKVLAVVALAVPVEGVAAGLVVALAVLQ